MTKNKYEIHPIKNMLLELLDWWDINYKNYLIANNNSLTYFVTQQTYFYPISSDTLNQPCWCISQESPWALSGLHFGCSWTFRSLPYPLSCPFELEVSIITLPRTICRYNKEKWDDLRDFSQIFMKLHLFIFSWSFRSMLSNCRSVI